MNLLQCDLPANDDDFMSRFILPAHYPIASGSDIRFRIRNMQEQIIICSNDYAQEIGFKDFNSTMFKRPDIDYERIIGSPEAFAIQMNYLKRHKKSFHFIYKYPAANGFYMTVSEPIVNFYGEVIGKKESDLQLKLLSHREIIENHFKRYNVAMVSMENILEHIELTTREELILFMLIGGYSQQEIGQFLHLSRSAILKIIAGSLCPKFNLDTVSSKLLVEKAVFMGFANYIPESFMHRLNSL